MFKYKISIYLKNGRIIHLRMKDYEFAVHENGITFSEKYGWVRAGRGDAFIVKKWWQRWG